MNLALLALAAVASAQPNMQDDPRLLRMPAVSGDNVVFAYAGDLWKCTLDGGTATRLTTFSGSEGMPRISPDGKTIAFVGSYDGAPEVYTMPIDGGEPKRITFTADPDLVLGWTPDGKIMVANGDQNTPFSDRLWLYSPNGGLPTGTPIREIANGSMSPDGSIVAYNRNASFGFNWRRYRGGTQGVVSFYNIKTNEYSEIPHGRENNWFPLWVGDQVIFASDKNAGTVNLYSYSVGNKRVTQLTNFDDADVRMPSTDGKTVVFERDGGLYAMNIASKAISRIKPRIVSDLNHVRPQMRRLAQFTNNMTVSPSGKRVAVEARGEIFSVPAKNGETRNLTNTPSARERNPVWSPDGQSILVMSDATGEYELYLIPQRGGKMEQLTRGGQYKIVDYRYSPDGKKISISTLDNRLLIMDVESKKVTQVVQEPLGPVTEYDWAPDGSYLVYAKALPNLQSAVALYRVRDGKTTQITEGFYSDSQVAFDLNGKYLYIVSQRSFNPQPGAFEYSLNFANAQRVYAIPLTKDLANPLTPASDEEPETKKAGASTEAQFAALDDEEPLAQAAPPATAAPAAQPEEAKKEEPKKEEPKELKIDFDGLSERMFALPWPDGNYFELIGVNNGVMTFVDGALVRFDFDSKQSVPIIGGVSYITLNSKKNLLGYFAGPGAAGVIPVGPGGQPTQGRISLDAVEAVIDPRTEWKQIFNEAWRYMRDRFYDPNFGGVDWNAKKKQYEAMLPYVQHRNDLNYVLGQMIGELGTGHAYVGGGEILGARPPVPIGLLGADYEVKNGRVAFQRIYRGDLSGGAQRGPLSGPGLNIKEGEYLLQIDGRDVGADLHPNEALMGKVGRTVRLTVNSTPSLTGAREVLVRPVGADNDIRYYDWVESNRRKVEKLSNGRIGYLHVPDTSEPGMIGFIRGYYSQSDKEAMIIDERFNGGGMIPTYFFDKINRTYSAFFRQRNGIDIGFPVQTFDGPYAMLINEYAGSGGDMFPWLFRKHKAGPLIGTRTWGGLVGITGSAPLVDGGFFTAPEFGIYDHKTGEWIAENTGVDPDIEIDNRPDLLNQGRDPQLEKAIEVLLKDLEKRKPVRKRPDFPKLTGPGK